MILMVILLANHTKDLKRSSRVFPYISLILTPLIMLHALTVDVKLAEVVKILIIRLFKVLTYDFTHLESLMSGKLLEKPSLSIIGYQFSSLTNNLGILFWIILIFIICLLIKLALYTFKITPNKDSENLQKYLNLQKNISETIYNYLSVHQIISMTSLTIYLWYEHLATGCFDVDCFLSDVKISATKLVKLDVVIAIVLIIGSLGHFWRILIILHWRKWFDL